MNFFGGKNVLWFQMDPSTMKTGAFRGSLNIEGLAHTIIGVLASDRGIAFLAQSAIPKAEVDIRFNIREREIPARVKIVSFDEINHHGKKAIRYFCEFVGIKADDWDLVVRYVKNTPETKVAVVESKSDEDFRILPQRVQTQIIEYLVRQKRLARPENSTDPLLKFRVIGTRALPEGLTMRDVNVHSQITMNGDPKRHDTRFRIRSDGKVDIV